MKFIILTSWCFHQTLLHAYRPWVHFPTTNKTFTCLLCDWSYLDFIGLFERCDPLFAFCFLQAAWKPCTVQMVIPQRTWIFRFFFSNHRGKLQWTFSQSSYSTFVRLHVKLGLLFECTWARSFWSWPCRLRLSELQTKRNPCQSLNSQNKLLQIWILTDWIETTNLKIPLVSN